MTTHAEIKEKMAAFVAGDLSETHFVGWFWMEVYKEAMISPKNFLLDELEWVICLREIGNQDGLRQAVKALMDFPELHTGSTNTVATATWRA